jgi:hypothetical protein
MACFVDGEWGWAQQARHSLTGLQAKVVWLAVIKAEFGLAVDVVEVAADGVAEVVNLGDGGIAASCAVAPHPPANAFCRRRCHLVCEWHGVTRTAVWVACSETDVVRADACRLQDGLVISLVGWRQETVAQFVHGHLGRRGRWSRLQTRRLRRDHVLML